MAYMTCTVTGFSQIYANSSTCMLNNHIKQLMVLCTDSPHLIRKTIFSKTEDHRCNVPKKQQEHLVNRFMKPNRC